MWACMSIRNGPEGTAAARPARATEPTIVAVRVVASSPRRETVPGMSVGLSTEIHSIGGGEHEEIWRPGSWPGSGCGQRGRQPGVRVPLPSPAERLRSLRSIHERTCQAGPAQVRGQSLTYIDGAPVSQSENDGAIRMLW